MAKAGRIGLCFLVHPCIGFRDAGVSVVAALLTFDGHFGVATFGLHAVVDFAFDAYVRGPGANQRPDHAEVFITGKYDPAA